MANGTNQSLAWPRAGAIRVAVATVVLVSVTAVSLPALAVPEPLSTPGVDASPDAPTPLMVTVDVADFAAEASQLPPGLTTAIERDTDLTAAEYLANAAAGDAARTVVDALDAMIDVRGSEMNGTELVVYVAGAGDAAVVESVGATAVIGEQPVTDVGDVLFQPAFDLRGGENYNESNIRCTTGFVGTNLTSATQVLTAGHCLGDDTEPRVQIRSQSAPFGFGTTENPVVTSGPTELGLPVEGSYQNGQGYDHGLIGLSNPATWTARPQIATWNYGGGSNTQNPLTVRDARAPIVNETACKSGATTGWTCGPIIKVNEYTCVGGDADNPATPANESRPCTPGVLGDYALNGIHATICMRGGDSGGPAMIGSTAIGINSASSAGATCRPSDLGVFAPLYSSGSVTPQNAFGNLSAATRYPNATWEVRVGVDQPTLANTASGVSRFTTTTLSGSIPFGSSRHALALEIDGSSSYSPTISPTGQWSVNVGPLSAGLHSYELQSTWGQRSSSPVASGTWLNAGVTRYQGDDRFHTAALIAQATFSSSVDRVFIASGLNFPDALAAGPVAARAGAPLLLVPQSGPIPASVVSRLTELAPRQIVIVGGNPSVGFAMEAALANYASDPVQPTVRLAGRDRFETARLLIESAAFVDPQYVWVVSGLGFADALSVGAAAAARGEPLVLVPGTFGAVDESTMATLRSLDPDRIKLAGSEATVSSAIATQLASIAPVDRYGGSDRFETSRLIAQASGLTSTTVYLANGLNFPDALAGGVAAGINGSPLITSFPWCVPSATIDYLNSQDLGDLVVLGGQPSISTAAANLTRC